MSSAVTADGALIMLRSLHIRNFVIVDSLSLEFGSGFTALTGETGAGKSILIDALSLALGDRAEATQIRAGAQRAEVSVEFELTKNSDALRWLQAQGMDDDAQCLLRRVVERSGDVQGDGEAPGRVEKKVNSARAGKDVAAVQSDTGIAALRSDKQASALRLDKEATLRSEKEASALRSDKEATLRSRAFINGTPVTLQQMRELADLLIDIHGQHAHQSLSRAHTQRELLDEYGGLHETVAQVAERFRAWQSLHKARLAFETNAAAFTAEKALLEEQTAELQSLAFSAESWRELQDEHKRLANAAALLDGANATHDALAEGEAAVLAQSSALISRLRALCEYDAALDDVVSLLDSAQVQLQEAAQALRRYCDRLDLDPRRLQEIETRLDAIHRLARKYHVNAEALPALLADAQQRLSELGSVGSVDELRQKEEAALSAYAQIAKTLSQARHRAAEELSDKVTQSLQQLAMSGARFAIGLPSLAAPSEHGFEQVEFLISSHAGVPPGALGKIASGGELSRISLAIQVVLANVAAVPTLIFDEVDAGIGGRVAEIVGRMLKQLGRQRQVLCVTHLPQVAACADQQYSVAKKETKGVVLSTINVLDDDARIEEIARMLGGLKITNTTRQHASELLSGPSTGRKKN